MKLAQKSVLVGNAIGSVAARAESDLMSRPSGVLLTITPHPLLAQQRVAIGQPLGWTRRVRRVAMLAARRKLASRARSLALPEAPQSASVEGPLDSPKLLCPRDPQARQQPQLAEEHPCVVRRLKPRPGPHGTRRPG
jgi:hypothetical protein